MKEVSRGNRVSLNTAKRLFYFQGDGGINLVAGEKESAVIPDTATDNNLKQINMAIRNEHLVVGESEVKVEMPDRDSDIKKMLDGGRNKIDEWIFNLKDDKKIRNDEKIAVLEKIIEFEKAGKNRKTVFLVAEKVLNSLAGISAVVETEQEKIEIKLTSGNDIEPDVK